MKQDPEGTRGYLDDETFQAIPFLVPLGTAVHQSFRFLLSRWFFVKHEE